MLKIIIAWIELFITLHTHIFPALSAPPPSYEAIYENLGAPLMSAYPDDPVSRSPWDIFLYDNKLFIAGGDYDKNTGPVPVYYYDTINQEWVNSGEIPDEQIEHFFVIDDKLMIPGCDPKEDWELGNIYEFRDNTWVTNRNIPGGIHQFDLAEYHDMVFVGLGVSAGEYPIAVSSDGGLTYHQLTMYKNGVPISTFPPEEDGITSVVIRTYELFVFQDELYAVYCFRTNLSADLEIYKYENGGFHYYCDFPDNISTKRFSYGIINAKVEYDGKLFFTTGNLYTTDNLQEVTKIELPGQNAVADLQLINGKMYALAIAKTPEGNFRSSIWLYHRGAFRELLYFSFPCPAISFTYGHNTLYFGMGSGIIDPECSEIGTILSTQFTPS